MKEKESSRSLGDDVSGDRTRKGREYRLISNDENEDKDKREDGSENDGRIQEKVGIVM